ncbi:prokineticin receptor 2-like [Lytechinus pictus]|uniref:prokineticin receptor 2-like n=1 Tax=Lytechinus pictus TaxID=7653 RepID=UPI00240E0633|nr:prokineticin receptor 2-like [Lytechinus pictus]
MMPRNVPYVSSVVDTSITDPSMGDHPLSRVSADSTLTSNNFFDYSFLPENFTIDYGASSSYLSWWNQTPGFQCEIFPQTVSTKTFLSVIFALVTVVCGPGNCLLCFLIARHKRLRSVTNLLIANLAVSDALVALICAPFSLQYYLVQNWVLPDFMCPVMATTKNVSLYVSVNTLLVIAVDSFWVTLYFNVEL